MKYKDKILILSAAVGDGHKQVARAMGEAVEDSFPGTEPIILDMMEWLHPYLSPISTYIYKKSIKKFPQVYSYLYHKTRVKSNFSTKLNALFTMGMHSMLEMIQAINPIAVVSTHPFAAGIISKLKEQGLIDIPAMTVITDYTDHSYWIHPFTDQYIVGTSQVKERLVSVGVEAYKIKNTGIPLRRGFLEEQPKEDLLKKYNLRPDKLTILVMGGGDGFFGKDASTFQAFEQISSSIQLIIVCGRNDKLKTQLEQELRDSKHDVSIMGFTENIHELMAISDLMITKAGGVTTSEAIAMQLPLLIFNPLPGQEEDNANFLLESGLGLLAKTPSDLIGNIQSILHDDTPLTFMRNKSRKFHTKTASLDAVTIMTQLINHAHKQEISLA
ncbi:MGDG synthase family glycosyltransferase [Falsibacillus albus]|uniref:Glycosyltransferase n=1 Tax=Falsibacillus albus TaxID=2478915 RepID=A0A3L7JJZ3_9BACI|nr:glycosyltransferase [Falsibacillus albus]RLQ89981.1 glycosyltransferase [Falsibacillus albus]